MKIIDVNLLLYANDLSSPFHSTAKNWAEELVTEGEGVGLAWITILAFLRITTNPRSSSPLPLSAARAAIREWLDQPSVVIVEPGERHWSILSDLLEAGQARGPLVMDAHLAALAIEHGATFCTNDRDFSRFPKLKVLFPLQG